MRLRRLLVAALMVAAVAGFFAFGLSEGLTLASLREKQAEITAWRDASPWAAAAAFFVTYVALAALSLPGAAAMTLVIGAVFGLFWGTLLVSFASSIGATLAFLASRFVLRDWVERRFGARLSRINSGFARDGAFYLLTLRLVPIIPFFLVNLLMGITPIRTWTYYWVSQVGMLAGTLVYVNAGSRLASIERASDILSPGLLIAFILLGIFPLIAIRLADWLRARRAYAGWKRPHRFDRNLIVIGGGAAGLVTAYIAAAVKARVTLIEKHRLGGDCLNTGCVPSKALIRSARLLSQIARSREFGIHSASARFDFADVMERVRSVIRAIEPHDSAERYEALGVEVVAGSATLVSPWEVETTDGQGRRQRLTSRAIVLATGARPFVPDIPGIAAVEPLTSDTVWNLRELPRRLLVLGGGPIGCELAQAFARLGSQVTLLEAAPRLLAREDPDVADSVAARFRDENIEVLTGYRAERFESETGERTLRATGAGLERRIAFDTLLVAVGRVANLEAYGLEALGIETGRTIVTNEFLQTRYPNIYAAGDVAGPYQFTHVAAHQAWYAAVNALFDPFRRFRADYSVIPAATFVDPEIARVGLNELEAGQRGIACEVTRFDLAGLDRAIAEGEARGFVKVLTAPGSDRILGATIVGEHAADVIGEFVLAMRHGLGLEKILSTIHIYPTMAEGGKYAAGEWKKAHAPRALLRWLERFHAWRR